MLSDYKDQIGTTAGILTLIQFLSPAILCKDIMKKGSSTGTDMMPFLGGLVLSTVFIQNALLIGDTIMLNVNLIAFVLGISYLVIYYMYTKEKAKFYIKLSKALIFVAVLISYAQRENPKLVNFRFGLVVTFILFALISAPLFSVGTILQTRNTDSLPMPLITSGTVVAFSWYLYGLAINDAFVQIQNLTAFLIQAFQIGLYVYVKIQKPVKQDAKFASKKKD